MCGICGVIQTENFLLEDKILRQMCDRLIHRGPDDIGMLVKENIGLGMRRLSIIDVSGGRQPIYNEDGTICIVFNGEIYNYLNLKEMLENKGHKFYTKTDTECIIHLYEEYGIKCVEKLRGMFAFAIWDDNKKHLYLARDRFGIKPLYYSLQNGNFIFASEIKAILEYPMISRDIDISSLHDYLTFLYVPSPRTMFLGINKLQASHWLRFSDGQVFIEQYWKLQFNHSENTMSEEEYSEQVYQCLKESVNLHLMSEVPLGAFLSGGIDSSGIVAIMAELMDRPVKTFSIGFGVQGLYNELQYARIIADRYSTEHQEFIVEPNAVELAAKIVWHLDEPMADASAVLNYLVARMAKEYVTVVLTGLGGDEIFAGYRRYCGNRIANWYGKIPPVLRYGFERIINILPASEESRLLNYSRLAKKFLAGSHLSPEERYFSLNSFFSEELKINLYSKRIRAQLDIKPSFDILKRYFDEVDSSDFLDRMQYVDQKTYLVEDPLMLTDKMSMANSLEARVPFLDHKVVGLAASIPPSLRLKGFETKYILKRSLDKVLPHEILNRKKQGFSMPIDTWLRNGLRDWCDDLLSEQRIKKRDYFNYNVVRWIIEKHREGKVDFSQHIWALLILEIWHSIFIDNERIFE